MLYKVVTQRIYSVRLPPSHAFPVNATQYLDPAICHWIWRKTKKQNSPDQNTVRKTRSLWICKRKISFNVLLTSGHINRTRETF